MARRRPQHPCPPPSWAPASTLRRRPSLTRQFTLLAALVAAVAALVSIPLISSASQAARFAVALSRAIPGA